MERAEQVYELYRTGKPISDEDIKFGIAHFRTLSDMMANSGATFRLACNEAYRVYQWLSDVQQARRSK